MTHAAGDQEAKKVFVQSEMTLFSKSNLIWNYIFPQQNKNVVF